MASGKCIRVGTNDNDSIKIEVEPDDTVLLDDVCTHFPGAKTLKFWCGDSYKAVKARVS